MTTLQILREEHAQDFFHLVQANKKVLDTWFTWFRDWKQYEDCVAFIQEDLQRFSRGERIPMGVWHGKELAGAWRVPLVDSEMKVAELTYWLGEEFRSRKLAKNISVALIDFLFQHGIERIEVYCLPDNQRSARLAQSLGFKEEGRFREAFPVNGHRSDVIVRGLLKKYWKP
ncbi:MAG: GNAT family N-acetyltransferase [Candidatus Wildermuthbacteria bacterium]|nr:GNAT family N-acetyltransferase [Candidatus Wildermuthbacteria bacterium]